MNILSLIIPNNHFFVAVILNWVKNYFRTWLTRSNLDKKSTYTMMDEPIDWRNPVIPQVPVRAPSPSKQRRLVLTSSDAPKAAV